MPLAYQLNHLNKFILLLIATLIAPLAQALNFPSLTDPSEETFMRNVKYSNRYAIIEDGKLDFEEYKSRSSEWYFERDGSYYRIKNRTTGEYLHTEYGNLQASDAPSGWWSSHWIVEKSSNYVRIRNRWRSNHYLHAQYGHFTSGTISSSWTGARWVLAAEPPAVTLSGTTSSFPTTSSTGGSSSVPSGLPDCTPLQPTSTTSSTTTNTVTLSGVVTNFPNTSGVASKEYTRIDNCWLPNSKIDIEDSELGLNNQYDTAASWKIEKYGNYYRIKNRATGEYLHNEYGLVEAGNVESYWWSAQWDIQEFDGYVKIRNRWKSNEYLHTNDGYLYLGPINSSWDSAKWKITMPLPTVDTLVSTSSSSSSSSAPSGANCTWNTTPSYSNGSYNTSYYEYPPIGACQHSLKKITTTYGNYGSPTNVQTTYQ